MRGTRGHMPNEAGELLRYHAEKQLCSTSDRSPGSWVQKVGPSPRPLAFPNEFVEWRTSGSLPTYSGGTAPVFHRTSLLCPFGHPRGYAVTLCATYRSAAALSISKIAPRKIISTSTIERNRCCSQEPSVDKCVPSHKNGALPSFM